MFQPLLDAFIESASIKKKLPLNPPLKIAVANWFNGTKEFKASVLY
ncbi:glycosyltransferase family 10 domain-containing protein, partial [Helicobacter pylori]